MSWAHQTVLERKKIEEADAMFETKNDNIAAF